MPQGSNVGSVGDLVRRKLVMQSMAGEERNIGAVVGEDFDGRSRRTPGGDGVDDGDGFIAFELSESCATDDGDVDGFWEKAWLVGLSMATNGLVR